MLQLAKNTAIAKKEIEPSWRCSAPGKYLQDSSKGVCYKIMRGASKRSVELNLSTQSNVKSRNFHSGLSAVEILSSPDNPENSPIHPISASFDVYSLPTLASNVQLTTFLIPVPTKGETMTTTHFAQMGVFPP
ncbi:hypothetical protein AVEN_172325-1 [Araneus ventricosus]|uniref:Uncharacterized protein n=1 Tax=Araneus ventricosus TaxID=182803 RepID=A0A4Y2E2T6_ARAVE|nr:hypothetical protein AVEN_172325-1 [Araneus ventricosus]